jgi:hypothetical protein
MLLPEILAVVLVLPKPLRRHRWPMSYDSAVQGTLYISILVSALRFLTENAV